MKFMLTTVLMVWAAAAGAAELESAKAASGVRFDGRAWGAAAAAADAVDARGSEGGAAIPLARAGVRQEEAELEIPPPADAAAEPSRAARGLRSFGRCVTDMHEDLPGVITPRKLLVAGCAAIGAVGGAVVTAPGVVTTVGGAVIGASVGAAAGTGLDLAFSAAACWTELFDPRWPERKPKEVAPAPQPSRPRASRHVRIIL
jgi:hypothetical protein